MTIFHPLFNFGTVPLRLLYELCSDWWSWVWAGLDAEFWTGVDYVNVGCTLMSSWLCCHNHNDFWLNIWFCFCKCSGWTDEGVLSCEPYFVTKYFKLFCFERARKCFSFFSQNTLSLLFTALRFLLHQAGLKALLGFLVFIPFWSPDPLCHPGLFFITPGTAGTSSVIISEHTSKETTLLYIFIYKISSKWQIKWIIKSVHSNPWVTYP